MIGSPIYQKLILFLEIIILGFFVNGIPYITSDFIIGFFEIKSAQWISFCVVLSRVFVTGVVYFFTDDIKDAIKKIRRHWSRIVLLILIGGLGFIYFLSHDIAGKI